MKRIAPSRWFAGIAIPIVLGSPQIGWACAVCSAGREDENRLAFILTTVFLTALPLTLVGGVVWWLRGRVRQMETAAAESSDLHALGTQGDLRTRSASPARSTTRVAMFPTWCSSSLRWLAWPRRLLRSGGR